MQLLASVADPEICNGVAFVESEGQKSHLVKFFHEYPVTVLVAVPIHSQQKTHLHSSFLDEIQWGHGLGWWGMDYASS